MEYTLNFSRDLKGGLPNFYYSSTYARRPMNERDHDRYSTLKTLQKALTVWLSAYLLIVNAPTSIKWCARTLNVQTRILASFEGGRNAGINFIKQAVFRKHTNQVSNCVSNCCLRLFAKRGDSCPSVGKQSQRANDDYETYLRIIRYE